MDERISLKGKAMRVEIIPWVCVHGDNHSLRNCESLSVKE